MIVCSDCLHHNPDNSTYCESCGVSLPVTSSCSNCGSPVESKAHYCGQCGFNLKLSQRTSPGETKATQSNNLLSPPPPPEPILIHRGPAHDGRGQDLRKVSDVPSGATSTNLTVQATGVEVENTSNTRIQTRTATLLHVQTNTSIDLKANQKLFYIGKSNDRLPPDINVGVYPNAEVVSRVHVALHLEDDQYLVEDLGSANGTYVNDSPLVSGVKRRLRTGDRLCLGKGDLVTFIFRLS